MAHGARKIRFWGGHASPAVLLLAAHRLCAHLAAACLLVAPSVALGTWSVIPILTRCSPGMLGSLTATELRQMCKAVQLVTTGKKEVLVERLGAWAEGIES